MTFFPIFSVFFILGVENEGIPVELGDETLFGVFEQQKNHFRPQNFRSFRIFVTFFYYRRRRKRWFLGATRGLKLLWVFLDINLRLGNWGFPEEIGEWIFFGYLSTSNGNILIHILGVEVRAFFSIFIIIGLGNEGVPEDLRGSNLFCYLWTSNKTILSHKNSGLEIRIFFGSLIFY